MKSLGRLFANLFEDRPTKIDPYREWDRLRAEALTPSHREEIDSIFGRQL